MKKKITIIDGYGSQIIEYITPKVLVFTSNYGINVLEFLSDDGLGRKIAIKTKETIIVEEIE